MAEESERAAIATFEIGLADKVTGPASKIVSVFDNLGSSAQKMLGSTDAASGGMSGLGAASGAAAGPVGLLITVVAAVAAAALAAGAALVGLAIKIAEIGIKAGEAKEKLVQSMTAMLGSAKAGQAALAVVEKLGDEFGMTREQLGPYAEKLLAAGVSANKLEASLRAVAAANAIVEGGGEKVTSILAKLAEQGDIGSKLKFTLTSLKDTGVTEADLMKALGMTPKMFELAKKQGKLTGKQLADAVVTALAEKGKGPLESQANTLTSIWAKFQENVADIFGGITKTEGYQSFIKALKDLLGIFGKDNAAGKAMSAGISGAFNKIFAAAAKALPYIKIGIEKVIIASLKAYIWIKQHWETIKTVLEAVAIVVGLLAVAFILSLIPIILLGVIFAVIVLAVIAVIAAFVALGKWLSGLGSQAGTAAKGLIDGLVKGITSGVARVIAAVKGLGAAAMGALKSALGIASPSKVFAALGAHIPAGLEVGIKGGSSGVKAASASMAASAVQGGAVGGKGAKGGSSKSVTITVQPGAISITGAQGDAATFTEVALTAMLERIRVAQGIGT